MAVPSRPVVPDFDLLRPLDKGGCGEVWLARSRLGIHVAIKLIPKGLVSDVEMEGIRAFKVHSQEHSNLIKIEHVGSTRDHYYCVMELADGYQTAPTFDERDYVPRTLWGDLKRNGPLPLPAAVKIVRQILGGLKHLHEHALLHRDIKPANVIFVRGMAKLADIGLVAPDGAARFTGQTLHYAPPGGVKDRGGDLYSLGRVFFQMVTGTSPERFPELPADASHDVIRAWAKIAPLVDRACSPDAKERFQDAAEFAAALDRVLPPPRPEQKRSLPIAAALVLIACAVVAAVVIPKYRARSAAADPTPSPFREVAGTVRLAVKDAADCGDPNKAAKIFGAGTQNSPPLRTGQCFWVEVELDRPCYPLVAAVSADLGVQVLYPDRTTEQARVSAITLPGEAGWGLKSPGGTLGFLLLASETSISDLESVQRALRGLGQLPTLPTSKMLTLADDGWDSWPGGSTHRGFDATEVIQIQRGFLDKVRRGSIGDLKIVNALIIPQVDPIQAGAPEAPEE